MARARMSVVAEIFTGPLGGVSESTGGICVPFVAVGALPFTV